MHAVTYTHNHYAAEYSTATDAIHCICSPKNGVTIEQLTSHAGIEAVYKVYNEKNVLDLTSYCA